MEGVYKSLCLVGAIAAVIFNNELFTLIVLTISAPIWMLWIFEKTSRKDARYGNDKQSRMF